MRGFSLVELMIALAIAAVLAVIALPGYGEVTRRSLRQDARLALLRIQHRQELHFIEHHEYAHAIAGDPAAGALGLAGHSDDGHYRLSVETSGMNYIAIASIDPGGRQARDMRCARLGIDHTGRRLVADAAGGWRDDDPDRCWG